MNEQEILETWSSYQSQLDAALAVNRENAIEITKLKVSSQLRSMKPIKWFTIGCGVVWCAVLIFVFVLSLIHSPPFIPFVLFMFVLTGINVISVCIYIYHLILIDRIDNSASVVSAQKDLANLKSSTLNVTRILLLPIPLYASAHLFIAKDPGVLFWVVNGIITAGFVAVTIWLLTKVSVKNCDQKWFKFLFDDREWHGVTKAIDMLKQVEEFESE